MSSDPQTHDALDSVAVVGMSGRFPGAKNLAQFWRNLRDGVECATFFSDEELAAEGVAPSALADKNFVRAGAVLDDVEMFDATFFGFNHREAQITDPQQRMFLECAWEALEDAGYDPERYGGLIGVYAGAALSTYLPQVEADRETAAAMGAFQIVLGNDKDHLTTHTAYKLNLKGPAFTVQTACSTSLVAVCLACQSLQAHYCDMALAGGVGVKVPQRVGYFYEQGGILSPDGHCRPFDARAQGIIPGNGLGLVVLKRLEDALRDGDHIYAVIRGAAVNNDGSAKVGYTAPSQAGQAEVIAMAQAAAGVAAETITYVEAHGTGTPLGDPIEVAALTQAFRASTAKKNFCAIGSVKSNVGHLDTAAGVAGLIKTVLALKHRALPPSLNFRQPNPEIDFENSPFYVNAALAEWRADAAPRRAGVSSFGIGGTNAHVVLEEAPAEPAAPEPAAEGRGAHLLVLSARTATALESATANLLSYLRQSPEANLANVAYTLQVGRRAFEHRRVLLCESVGEASDALETLNPQKVFNATRARSRPVVFMFPGQGAQHVNMAAELYRVEQTFRAEVDRLCGQLAPALGVDLRELLYPPEGGEGDAARLLRRTDVAQAALFTVEYALARLWLSWGVRPQAMIGHSVGEYVAACLAGVLSLEDALALVAERGRLMRAMPEGAMLAVNLPAADAQAMLGGELSLAAVNAPSLCVVSGPLDAVSRFEARAAGAGVTCKRLDTSHAFHSKMMEPLLEEFTERVRRVRLNEPRIPYLSNVTGGWATAAEVTEPSYWARHLRQTVQFAAGAERLMEEPSRILLEVGPGRTLHNLLKWHAGKPAGQSVLASLAPPLSRESDGRTLLSALGHLWLAGVEVDWPAFHAHERRRRLPLPTYPFERQHYWVSPSSGAEQAAPARTQVSTQVGKKPDIADWFYVPSWKAAAPLKLSADGPAPEPVARWLIFCDETGLGRSLARRLEEKGQEVFTVCAGSEFAAPCERRYVIDPRRVEDYRALFGRLRELGQTPGRIFHLWGVTPCAPHAFEPGRPEEVLERGFHSLNFMLQALAEGEPVVPLRLGVVSNGLHVVTGDETACPEKATLLGSCQVIPQEYPHIECRSIDILLPEADGAAHARLLEQLCEELSEAPFESVVAYRGTRRWTRFFEPVRLGEAPAEKSRLREGGVYLITGGLGGIGLVLARHLARAARARLVLLGRSAFPERSEWADWLAAHDAQDETSLRIEELKALEELGAEVLVVSADVADEAQMREALGRARRSFGALHGVIHAAGLAGGGIIQLKTREEAERVLAPKVNGTLVLERLLRDARLDFLILCSSLSSVLGGVGQVDYCAANAFLDAFAQSRAADGGADLTISVNWDAWQEVGMAARVPVPPELEAARRESLRSGITNEEATDVFARLLQYALPQVVVSTVELQGRVQQHASRADTGEPAPDEHEGPHRVRHPRPDLETDYVEPQTETERVIADLWQELLGVESVGVHDDFLELGGHSLLAIQLSSRLRQAFHVEVSVRVVFEAPTVARLAEVIRPLKEKEEVRRPKITRLSREQRRVRLPARGDPEPQRNDG